MFAFQEPKLASEIMYRLKGKQVTLSLHTCVSSSKPKWVFSGVSRSDWKEWECHSLLAPDVFHNGERQSVYKVSRRSPRSYLKQVICVYLSETISILSSRAPEPPSNQRSSHAATSVIVANTLGVRKRSLLEEAIGEKKARLEATMEEESYEEMD